MKKKTPRALSLVLALALSLAGLRHRSRSTAPGGYGDPYRPQRPKGARRGSGPL